MRLLVVGMALREDKHKVVCPCCIRPATEDTDPELV